MFEGCVMRAIQCMFIGTLFVVAATGRAELHHGLTLTVDEVVRSYDLYVPGKGSYAKRPLVILYHGHFGSSALMTGAGGNKAPYKRWLALAEQYNFLVAIPNGEKGADGKRGWNDCRADTTTNPHTDDVKFTLALIGTIDRRFPVDQTRIYANGTSNGGNMAIRLAMEVPEQFAAVAAVVASNPLNNECQEKRRPVPILFMNGTHDPLLPFAGGKVGKDRHGRGTVLSTAATIDYWIMLNSAHKQPVIYEFEDSEPQDQSTVVRYTYEDGRAGAKVVLYEVRNGGHTEPSRTEHYGRLYRRIVGNQNYDIEMADEVWQFFTNKIRQPWSD